jgi:CBS domain-containing protein
VALGVNEARRAVMRRRTCAFPDQSRDRDRSKPSHACNRTGFCSEPAPATERAAGDTMKALDVMVRNVVTVKPDDAVADAVRLLAEHDISAPPVVDDGNNVVGVISEADLLHRDEMGTEKQRPWWLEAVTPASTLAGEFAKSHGRRVAEVMSTDVVSAAEDTPLGEIGTMLERYRIKRVPVLRGGKLVGVVSRSNLIQALASSRAPAVGAGAEADRKIRQELLDRLSREDWTDFGERNVIVSGGIVHLWGLVGSLQEHKALLALAEGVPGVASVSDEMIPAY